jgi:DNA-binding response OmpR family regulator
MMQDIDTDNSRQRATVLVADDEHHAIVIVRHLLAQAGYRPVTTVNPYQVTQLVESESPDLVLLDIGFPEASGFDVFRGIRQCSEVPIIFFTASDREEDVRRASELGAADYITKPYSPAELLARVGTALR